MSAACRSCGAPIVWALTKNMRRMPVNADPDPKGTLTIENDPEGETVVRGISIAELRDGTTLPRYSSHFATCPKADEHRRPHA